MGKLYRIDRRDARPELDLVPGNGEGPSAETSENRRMKFTVLGSGSTGNAVLISTETTNVLVDAGLSAREILRRLAIVGVDCADLDGIVITHEHSDHIGGLRSLLRSVRCPVFVSLVTEDAYYWTRAGGVNGDSEATK